MAGDLNGVAHVILTAGDFARSTAFWRATIAYLDLLSRMAISGWKRDDPPHLWGGGSPQG